MILPWHVWKRAKPSQTAEALEHIWHDTHEKDKYWGGICSDTFSICTHNTCIAPSIHSIQDAFVHNICILNSLCEAIMTAELSLRAHNARVWSFIHE